MPVNSFLLEHRQIEICKLMIIYEINQPDTKRFLEHFFQQNNVASLNQGEMSDSTTKQSTIYDLNNGSYASNSPYAISAFPRTMVCLQLNATDGSTNVVINQQLCNTDGIIQTNTDCILLSASAFTELLIQLQGLEMIFN